MSWRIEHADPVALLGELPNGLAQTGFLIPPRHTPLPVLLATLSELRRVTRGDGTLWVAGREHRRLALLACCTGWATTHESQVPRATLLATSGRYHFNARPAPLHLDTRSYLYKPRRVDRRGSCLHGALSRLAIEWCVQGSTSPSACGVCGAPWRRSPARTGRARCWRATCEHTNNRGRCIVLDPFCGTSPVGPVAVRLGRAYLGIDPNPTAAERARRPLARTQREALA